MRELIKKADGSPVKSRIYAVKFLEEKGISKENLITENGMFYYDIPNAICEENLVVEKPTDTKKGNVKPVAKCNELDWETPVIDENEVNTSLKIKSADVVCKLKAKHPAGQNMRRPYNAVEVEIDNETFIFSLLLAQKLFSVEV